MGDEVFKYHTQNYGVSVWRLGPHDAHPGDFMIETYGDPSLTKEQFAEMAKRVAAAAKQPARISD